jgi:hypothetical protein
MPEPVPGSHAYSLISEVFQPEGEILPVLRSINWNSVPSDLCFSNEYWETENKANVPSGLGSAALRRGLLSICL